MLDDWCVTGAHSPSGHDRRFDSFPIGEGYEVDVTEFDYRKENEVCYDKNGVTVRHWPRSHGKAGASAYRLDWNGLSFVWTGDGRPDELTIKYSQGVDVFVTEVQNDLAQLMSLKTGYPPPLYNFVMDTYHTPHYAAGYLFQQINPRIGMVTHLEHEPELNDEVIAGIRTHWDGLFVIGAPDVKVVNVTPDAIWVRDAALPALGSPARPPIAQMLAKMAAAGQQIPKEIEFPAPRLTREGQQEEYLRQIEIDPARYYPKDLNRDLITSMPPIKINVEQLLKSTKKGK